VETPRERTADRRRAARATTAPEPDLDQSIAGLAATAAAIVLIAVLIRVAFPDRSDYAGHFLAGAGATAMMLAVVSAFARGLGPGRTIAWSLVAVGLGVVTERTIFREAAFDWVDFALQSSGALLVATAFLGFGDGRRSDVAFGIGFALLLGGFWFAFG
jgi:hypothetical protein